MQPDTAPLLANGPSFCTGHSEQLQSANETQLNSNHALVTRISDVIIVVDVPHAGEISRLEICCPVCPHLHTIEY